MSRNFTTAVFCAALSFISVLPTFAQPKRASPHETVSAIMDPSDRNNSRVTLYYGRPYTKSPSGEVREVWGKLVPYGKVWRLGADESTTLITQKPLTFGTTEVPAGAYTLFLIPNEDGTGKLVINKQLGQWGLTYDEKMDLARVDVKREDLSPATDQLAMAVESTGPNAGRIKIMWDKSQYVIPFTMKK